MIKKFLAKLMNWEAPKGAHKPSAAEIFQREQKRESELSKEREGDALKRAQSELRGREALRKAQGDLRENLENGTEEHDPTDQLNQ